MKVNSFRQWNDELVARVGGLLADELALPAGVPGGMESYRGTLTASFFFKFFVHVQLKLWKEGNLV